MVGIVGSYSYLITTRAVSIIWSNRWKLAGEERRVSNFPVDVAFGMRARVPLVSFLEGYGHTHKGGYMGIKGAGWLC